MDLPLEEYLKPTPVIDCDTRSIKEKVQERTNGQGRIPDKAKSLFYFARDEIKFDGRSPRYLQEHYRASAILAKGGGYCVQKAVVLAALGRAAGIPTRLRFADIRNRHQFAKLVEKIGTNLFIYHGYDEFYIDGRWIKVAPTFDLEMCQKDRIIPVEFDGIKDALLPSHNQDGKPHIEYVCDHGHYPDLPLDELEKARLQGYGAETEERMKHGLF